MKMGKVEKLVMTFTWFKWFTENVINIRNFKQTLNHGLILKKVHRVIKFHQNFETIFGYQQRSQKKKDFEK